MATPIGNLSDISLRALAIFQAADIVYAEDTRVTGQLLSAYGIQANKLISLREHNERSMAEQVITRLQEGKIIVQVSDAGTPAISDPGARLVESVKAAGLAVCPVPGASAVVAALSASGLTANSFLFHGFLPPKSTERKKVLANWREVEHITICYEAPHRLADSLADIVAELGEDRHVVLARELTKTFETIRKLPAAELLAWVQQDHNQQRGEVVLVIDAAPAVDADEAISAEALRVLQLLAAELPTKQAANLTSQITGDNKKQLYDAALKLKK